MDNGYNAEVRSTGVDDTIVLVRWEGNPRLHGVYQRAVTPEVKIYAPWTPSEVYWLNHWQNSGKFHPFTCKNRGQQDHLDDKLIATQMGWICSYCTYTQNWAHVFMAEDQEQARVDATKEFLEDWEKEHGEFTEEEIAEAEQALGESNHYEANEPKPPYAKVIFNRDQEQNRFDVYLIGKNSARFQLHSEPWSDEGLAEANAFASLLNEFFRINGL